MAPICRLILLGNLFWKVLAGTTTTPLASPSPSPSPSASPSPSPTTATTTSTTASISTTNLPGTTTEISSSGPPSTTSTRTTTSTTPSISTTISLGSTTTTSSKEPPSTTSKHITTSTTSTTASISTTTSLGSTTKTSSSEQPSTTSKHMTTTTTKSTTKLISTTTSLGRTTKTSSSEPPSTTTKKMTTTTTTSTTAPISTTTSLDSTTKTSSREPPSTSSKHMTTTTSTTTTEVALFSTLSPSPGECPSDAKLTETECASLDGSIVDGKVVKYKGASNFAKPAVCGCYFFNGGSNVYFNLRPDGCTAVDSNDISICKALAVTSTSAEPTTTTASIATTISLGTATETSLSQHPSTTAKHTTTTTTNVDAQHHNLHDSSAWRDSGNGTNLSVRHRSQGEQHPVSATTKTSSSEPLSTTSKTSSSEPPSATSKQDSGNGTNLSVQHRAHGDQHSVSTRSPTGTTTKTALSSEPSSSKAISSAPSITTTILTTTSTEAAKTSTTHTTTSTSTVNATYELAAIQLILRNLTTVDWTLTMNRLATNAPEQVAECVSTFGDVYMWAMIAIAVSLVACTCFVIATFNKSEFKIACSVFVYMCVPMFCGFAIGFDVCFNTYVSKPLNLIIAIGAVETQQELWQKLESHTDTPFDFYNISICCFGFGAALSAQLGRHVTDFFGRKITMILIGVMLTIASGVQMGTCSTCEIKDLTVSEFLYAGRTIAGIATGLVLVNVPAYVYEISPRDLQNFFTSLFSTFIAMGAFTASRLSADFEVEPSIHKWVAVVQWQLACAILLLLGSCCCVLESPQWLAHHRMKDNAEDSTRHIHGSDNFPIEFTHVLSVGQQGIQLMDDGAAEDIESTPRNRVLVSDPAHEAAPPSELLSMLEDDSDIRHEVRLVELEAKAPMVRVLESDAKHCAGNGDQHFEQESNGLNIPAQSVSLFVVPVVLMFLQQLSGPDFYDSESPEILQELFGRCRIVNKAILHCVIVVSTLLCACLTQWLGPRAVLRYTTSLLAICSALIAFLGSRTFPEGLAKPGQTYTKYPNTDDASKYTIAVSIYIFMASFSAAFTATVWPYITSISPFSGRSIGLSLATSALGVATVVSQILFRRLYSLMNFHIFWLFTLMNVLVLCYVCRPSFPNDGKSTTSEEYSLLTQVETSKATTVSSVSPQWSSGLELEPTDTTPRSTDRSVENAPLLTDRRTDRRNGEEGSLDDKDRSCCTKLKSRKCF